MQRSSKMDQREEGHCDNQRWGKAFAQRQLLSETGTNLCTCCGRGRPFTFGCPLQGRGFFCVCVFFLLLLPFFRLSRSDMLYLKSLFYSTHHISAFFPENNTQVWGKTGEKSPPLFSPLPPPGLPITSPGSSAHPRLLSTRQ